MTRDLGDQPMFGCPIAPWHRWFAWHPVRTFDARWIWLRWVERRRIQKHDYLPKIGANDWWQYRYLKGYVSEVQ